MVRFGVQDIRVELREEYVVGYQGDVTDDLD